MVRAPFTDHNGIRKGAWSKEEDDILRAYVLRYGHWNWRALPKYAGLSRCGKSCRLRWINYLRPGVKHGNYTEQEEDLIIELHEKYGNKWSKISAKLPGRTDNEIKNHWHTHLKKRTKQSESSSGFQEKHSSRKQSSEIRDLKVAVIDPSVPILESSSLSPESSSFSSEFSQLNCDSAMIAESSSTSTSSNWNITEDIFTSFQTSEISSEDFWTQPFVPEQDAYTLPNLPIEDGLMSAYFSSYQDSIDIFYQIMQELPAN